MSILTDKEKEDLIRQEYPELYDGIVRELNAGRQPSIWGLSQERAEKWGYKSMKTVTEISSILYEQLSLLGRFGEDARMENYIFQQIQDEITTVLTASEQEKATVRFVATYGILLWAMMVSTESERQASIIQGLFLLHGTIEEKVIAARKLSLGIVKTILNNIRDLETAKIILKENPKLRVDSIPKDKIAHEFIVASNWKIWCTIDDGFNSDGIFTRILKSGPARYQFNSYMRKVAEKLSRFGLLKAETENRIYITEYIAPIMDWTNYNIDRKQEKRLSFQRSDYIKSWDIILEFLNNQTFDPTRVLDQNTQDILVLRSFFSKNVKTLVSTSWFTVKMLEDALLRIDDNKTKLLSSRIHVLLSEIVNIIGRNRNVRILVFAFIVLYSTVANVKKIVADGLLSRSEFFEAIDLAPSIVQPLFISKASFYSFFNAKAIKSDKYNSDVFAKIIFASDDEPLKDVVRKLEIYSNKGIVE